MAVRVRLCRKKCNDKRCLLPLTCARKHSKAIRWCCHSSEHVPAMWLSAGAKRQMPDGPWEEAWPMNSGALTSGCQLNFPFSAYNSVMLLSRPREGLDVATWVSSLKGEARSLLGPETVSTCAGAQWLTEQLGTAPGKKWQTSTTLDLWQGWHNQKFLESPGDETIKDSNTYFIMIILLV